MSDDPYTPIDCGDYDIYEIAIMQRKPLRLKWRNKAGEHFSETVIPLELQVKDKAEFLRIEPLAGEQWIRLDWISQAEIPGRNSRQQLLNK